MSAPLVWVEFYGIPRLRAGRATLEVRAGTVAEVLAATERACPGLSGLVQIDGAWSPGYLVSLNGQEFIEDPRHKVREGDRLLLLSADAGG